MGYMGILSEYAHNHLLKGDDLFKVLSRFFGHTHLHFGEQPECFQVASADNLGIPFHLTQGEHFFKSTGMSPALD